MGYHDHRVIVFEIALVSLHSHFHLIINYIYGEEDYIPYRGGLATQEEPGVAASAQTGGTGADGADGEGRDYGGAKGYYPVLEGEGAEGTGACHS